MEKKVMSDYSCYCTPEQTKKALELGAPIQQWHGFKENAFTHLPTGTIMDKGTLLFIPTAEEMLGWLGEQGLLVDITHSRSIRYYGLYRWEVYEGRDVDAALYSEVPLPRKEATIAAINAALDYLSKKN